MVCVFPAPVAPYANTDALYPSNSPSMIGLQTWVKIEEIKYANEWTATKLKIENICKRAESSQACCIE